MEKIVKITYVRLKIVLYYHLRLSMDNIYSFIIRSANVEIRASVDS